MARPSRDFLLVFLVLAFAPGRAYMSQVHSMQQPHDWAYSFAHAPIIVVATASGDPRVFKEKVFPRSTHFQKNEETVAREWASPYVVIDILRPGAPALAYGQEILVWQEPAYGLDALEYYHTTGLIESPMVLEQTPVFSPDGTLVILFLEPHENIYRRYGQAPDEGLGLLEEARGLASVQALIPQWHYDGRSSFHENGTAWWITASGFAAWHAIRYGANGSLEEQYVLWKINSTSLEEILRLLRGVDWAALTLSRPLVPEESKPRMVIAAGALPGYPLGLDLLLNIQGPTPAAVRYGHVQNILAAESEHLPWLPAENPQTDWWPGLLQ